MAAPEASDLSHAVTTVLSNPELLESILLRLDLRTLLTSAQLVNRPWHELVTNSTALQRALFFRPEDRARVPNWTPEDNPLLAAAFPPFFIAESDEISSANFVNLPMAARLDAFTREEASWRRMLTLQPPATRVGFWKCRLPVRGNSHSFEVEVFPGGLTMGRLYDIVQQWTAQNVSSACIARTNQTSGTVNHILGWQTHPDTITQLNGLAKQSDMVVKLSMLTKVGRGDSREGLPPLPRFGGEWVLYNGRPVHYSQVRWTGVARNST